jgi:hypothetical protein
MNDEQLRDWGQRTNEIASDLMEANPDLHPVTASIIANDLLSAEHRTKQVAAGADATDVVWLVGSYARWDWAITMVSQGKISTQWFSENIADLWRGSDPDDTKHENLAIWQHARRTHGGVIRDDKPLPKPDKDGMLRVYRGITQPGGERGIAWTTDPKIAAKFASGAGERIPVVGGVVITGRVRPSSVLAYLTERGESEVIVDPRLISDMRPVRGS